MSSYLNSPERNFAASVYLSESPIQPDPPPPFHTVYVPTVHLQVQVQVQMTGKGGGVVLNQSYGKRGNRGEYRSQIWVKIPS
jgi:hypothetical protein